MSYNKADSKYMTITCGVPQGSILGPLLFILYINDIENVSDILYPILFADDTSLCHAHTCFNTLIEEINIEIQKNLDMFPYQQTFLKHQKVYFIIFTPKGKTYNINSALIQVDGNKIKHVKFTKFLGIFIDEHLSWTTHIDNLSKQVARNVGNAYNK